MFIDYNNNSLKEILTQNKGKVIIRGAGTLGKIAINALYKLNIKVDYFWEDDPKKQGLKYCEIDVLDTDQVSKIEKNANIFLASNYFAVIIPQIKKLELNNIFNVYELIKKTDFKNIISSTDKEIHNFGEVKKFPFNQRPIEIERVLDTHYTSLQTQNSQAFNDDGLGNLNIKYIDLVITERCSMKCVDCSNLMQYYKNPRNSTFEEVKKSVEVTMSSIDYLSEFRVIGGEPFMNKDIGRIINLLKTFKNLSRIIIYTNATIVPKNDTLKSLMHEKVSLDITRYETHKHSINNHEKLMDVLKENKINYITHTADRWTDSGRVKKYKRTENELQSLFHNCCVGDILSILNGKLYRCPFSANAHNINAIPYNEKDIIDLLDENIKADVMRENIKKLYTRKDRKEYLTACKFCRGRDLNTPEIPAGLQTKVILENPKFSE
jgi:organic radical activating enzyme